MALSGLRFKLFGVYPQNLNRSTTERLIRRLDQNAQASARDQEVNDLEARVMLSPSDDAPEVPSVLSAHHQRLFVTIVAGVVFVVTYGSGTLHM